jgi:hypothetical protein
VSAREKSSAQRAPHHAATQHLNSCHYFVLLSVLMVRNACL